MGEGEIGAKTERSLVARERLDIAALLMTHITELIMRLGECGKLSQSNFKLRDSFVESARSGKRNGIIMTKLRVVRQQTHRSLVGRERFGSAASVRERAGELAVGARAIGPLCDVVLPNGNGRVVVAVAPCGE